MHQRPAKTGCFGGGFSPPQATSDSSSRNKCGLADFRRAAFAGKGVARQDSDLMTEPVSHSICTASQDPYGDHSCSGLSMGIELPNDRWPEGLSASGGRQSLMRIPSITVQAPSELSPSTETVRIVLENYPLRRVRCERAAGLVFPAFPRSVGPRFSAPPITRPVPRPQRRLLPATGSITSIGRHDGGERRAMAACRHVPDCRTRRGARTRSAMGAIESTPSAPLAGPRSPASATSSPFDNDQGRLCRWNVPREKLRTADAPLGGLD